MVCTQAPQSRVHFGLCIEEYDAKLSRALHNLFALHIWHLLIADCILHTYKCATEQIAFCTPAQKNMMQSHRIHLAASLHCILGTCLLRASVILKVQAVEKESAWARNSCAAGGADGNPSRSLLDRQPPVIASQGMPLRCGAGLPGAHRGPHLALWLGLPDA